MQPPRKRSPGPPTPGHAQAADITVTDVLTVSGTVTSMAEWRFGRPSTYSLAPWELASHIRHLRRDGWQSWEIRVRFDTGEWAA